MKVLNTSTLKQIFWKTETFFKKLKYPFLVESTKIENPSFSYKTAISEANIKTNRMVNTKWIYRKERSLASNYFIFLKIFVFSLRTSYIELTWFTYDQNVHIRTFCKRWNYISSCFFPLTILNRWSYSKNEVGAKLNHIYCVNQLLREERHKNETKNVNKNSLVCSIFVIFLIFRPLELWK